MFNILISYWAYASWMASSSTEKALSYFIETSPYIMLFLIFVLRLIMNCAL